MTAATDRAAHILYGDIHRDRPVPRLRALGWNAPALAVTEDEILQVLYRDASGHCRTRIAGSLVDVECGPPGDDGWRTSRFTFWEGALVTWFQNVGAAYEKSLLAGSSLRPVARYRKGSMDVIVLDPGVALVRAGDLWLRLEGVGFRATCERREKE